MKIVFLGTSHGRPEKDRRCSSILLEVLDRRYLIDIGTNANEQLANMNIPVKSINAIFITHMHGDHTNGLLPFVELCNWAYKDAEPTILIPDDIEKVKTAINGWLKCNNIVEPRALNYLPVKSGQVFDDGVIKVTAVKTEHIANSYAYLVETSGRRVLFSGDMSGKGPDYDFPKSVLELPLDLAVCESAHFNPTEYLSVFKGNKNVKRVCFNHYTERFLPFALSMKELLSGVEVSIAHDGMEIEV